MVAALSSSRQGQGSGRVGASASSTSLVKDQYKYSDDLSILELIMLADALTEYNFLEHVASDVGVDQLFLPPQGLETQVNLDKIAQWTDSNLMKLKESKTSYIFFQDPSRTLLPG